MAKRIVAVIADLIFTVKISDAAKRAGVAVDFVKTAPDAIAKAGGAAGVLLDLDFAAPEWIVQLKALGVPLTGYVSHVQTETIRRAKESGCDVVMARSAFVQKLAEIMAGFAG